MAPGCQRRRGWLLAALGTCLACRPAKVLFGDTGVVVDSDSGVTDTAARDSGDTGSWDSGLEPLDSVWCADFEDGTLADAGYEGSSVTLHDGALVFVVEEGQSFSGLVGEEKLKVRGDYAVAVRSSELGNPASVGIATSPAFTVEHPLLWWWQLSEVREEGIVLYADLLDEGGALVASLDLPVETGGYIPGLESDQPPIPALPEIVVGEGAVGHMVRQVSDVSPWLGQTLRLRLYQHTAISLNGFFTLFDDICHGSGDVDAIEWGEVDPTHR